MISNVAMFVGGGLSLLVTKQRPHNMACGALSYMAAKQVVQHMDSEPNELDRLPLTTKEYDWLERQLEPSQARHLVKDRFVKIVEERDSNE